MWLEHIRILFFLAGSRLGKDGVEREEGNVWKLDGGLLQQVSKGCGLIKAFLPSVKLTPKFSLVIIVATVRRWKEHKLIVHFYASDILFQVTTFSQMVFSNMTGISSFEAHNIYFLIVPSLTMSSTLL